MLVKATSQTMVGKTILPFTLTDARTNQAYEVTGKNAKVTVLAFIANECAFVKHILSSLVEFSTKTPLIAINPNANKFGPESLTAMQAIANKYNFNFPYLFDIEQKVAYACKVSHTPLFYVLNQDFTVMYQGRFDAATPMNSILVTGEDLAKAVDNVLHNLPMKNPLNSTGCSIKWRHYS